MKDLISVCITTKNEEDYIGFCLESILNQTYDGNKEIIVLDSNSCDKTVEIARKYADKVVVKESTIPQGRNLAVKQSEGNILCFLDADIVLSEDWFDTLLPTFILLKMWRYVVTLILWRRVLNLKFFIVINILHIEFYRRLKSQFIHKWQPRFSLKEMFLKKLMVLEKT